MIVAANALIGLSYSLFCPELARVHAARGWKPAAHSFFGVDFRRLRTKGSIQFAIKPGKALKAEVPELRFYSFNLRANSITKFSYANFGNSWLKMTPTRSCKSLGCHCFQKDDDLSVDAVYVGPQMNVKRTPEQTLMKFTKAGCYSFSVEFPEEKD